MTGCPRCWLTDCMKRLSITLPAVLLLGPLGALAAEEFNEADYKRKYPFAVERASDSILSYPDGNHTVHARYAIRECDAEGGAVPLLSFYSDKQLLRSHALRDLVPDPDDRTYHVATGVFIWLIFNPKENGFDGDVFTVVTEAGVQRFDVRTGARLKSEVGVGNSLIIP